MCIGRVSSRSKQQGLQPSQQCSMTQCSLQLRLGMTCIDMQLLPEQHLLMELHVGSEKELSLGTSPQESRLTQPKGSPGLRQSPSPSGNMGLTAFQAKGPSSSRQTPTPGRDKGVSPGKFMDLQKQMDALRAKLQVRSHCHSGLCRANLVVRECCDRSASTFSLS